MHLQTALGTTHATEHRKPHYQHTQQINCKNSQEKGKGCATLDKSTNWFHSPSTDSYAGGWHCYGDLSCHYYLRSVCVTFQTPASASASVMIRWQHRYIWHQSHTLNRSFSNNYASISSSLSSQRTKTYHVMTRWTTSEKLTRKIQLGSVLTDIRKTRCALSVFLLQQLDSVCSQDGRLHVATNVTTIDLHWRRYVASTITVNIRLECRLEIYIA